MANTTISPAPVSGPVAATPETRRVVSVDALRGFDMFWILGADALVHALNRMASGGTGPFASLARFLGDQLEHVDWQGFHFYDLIFPLFVFIVGTSIVFSLTRLVEREGKREAHKRVLRRFVLLFILALIFSGGVSTEWPNIRLLGVLNRIALCYLFAALLFLNVPRRGLAIAAASLLIGYWALMTFVPFPDVRPVDATGGLVSEKMKATDVSQLNWASTNKVHGVFDPGFNLANYVDARFLPGKKWDKTWDPEGLLSTIPAIATCLLGVFAGLLLKSPNVSEQKKVVYLIGGGVLLAAAGWLWSLQFPVVKKIWTSSFVLVAGGYSAILLGIFHQIVDVWGWQRWASPFIWIGANAITLYMGRNIVDFRKLATRFAGGDVKTFLDAYLGIGAGDLVLAGVTLLIVIILAQFLYRRKIFLRV